MGSISEFDQVPTLTAIERIGPKGYVRYIFPFQLDDDYDIDEVSRVLRAAYAATQRRVPAMACEAVPDMNTKQAGVLKLQKLDDEAIEDIVIQDLRVSDTFPTSYAELKSNSFPVASLDADLLCRRSVWPSAGERLPISLVQANFIRGGLLLNWCTLHLVGDGTSYFTWMKIWAEECRRAQGLYIPEPVELPPAVVRDRERVMRSSGRNLGLLESHPEYTLLPFTPSSAPPKMMAQNHRAQVFYFSPEALQALKAEASPVNTSVPSDQKWISTNDALSALLWRTVMKVQWPWEILEGDPISVFNIAIDGRLRTEPPVHPDTLGCFLEYVAVSVPIRKIVGSTNIADLAILIRKAILKADKQFTDDLVALIEKLEDVDRLVPTAFLDVPGFNCVQTSWINFKLYSLDWGSLLGHNIGAVRLPHVGIINGLQVVLPAPPDGGMEILVGVEESCLDKLLQDPLWMKYAVPR
ncbi:alanine--tRNA ligase [Aspergillus flavus]|nr:alanine--tRNA ligase [Aspergillus flavus]